MAVKINPERLIRASGNGLINTVQSLCDPLKSIHIPQDVLDQAVLSALQGTVHFKDTHPLKAEQCWQIVDRLCHVRCNDHHVSEECLDKVLLAAVAAQRTGIVKSLLHLKPPPLPSIDAIHAGLQQTITLHSSHKWELMIDLCRMGVTEDGRTLVFTELAKALQWQAIDSLYAAGLRPQQAGVDFMLHHAAKNAQWDAFQTIIALQEPGRQAAGQFLKMAVRAGQRAVVLQLCKLTTDNAIAKDILLEAMAIATATKQPAIAFYLKAHFIASDSLKPLTAVFSLLKDYLPPENHHSGFFKASEDSIERLKEVVLSMARGDAQDEEDSQIIRDIVFTLKSNPLYLTDLPFIAMVNYIVEHYTDDHYVGHSGTHTLQ
ncbi:hypothetical protein DIZ81_12765 [Legionella taurinensis]|uniref:Ankyrin repeat domain-containing protein n=1 Tax=Legionella taurinensis TaxID=70611 RepID=A0AB38N1Y3_9GAMM|nr:hypothetical protein [Legionella taurinensis]MDX1838717.1 hypothetical protein [Legionella taurinensis]PUT38783.1 hypothetical protein DB744_12460 [Legionella taurinensis]PUT40219.1 hypothetical protein DB746_12175 [Legionella taurinensis]PUT42526.1 hypothetical protein DB743_12660 [Legionella taurinensis]PUT45945.1 hypothetical protein DB745_12570 [Legionella taurinensis]